MICKCLKVACGNQSLRLRTTSNAKVKDWVAAINDAGLRPHEGWCHPHRFGSFAPPRGLTDDGSRAQWFVDGQAAFEAIASSVEAAKSEVCFLRCLHQLKCISSDYTTQHRMFASRYSSLAGGFAQNCI